MKGRKGVPKQYECEPLAVGLSADHVQRNELISMLLQERNVLRVLSAPHGFGKSELAREYAVRLFSGSAVAWIDGGNADFVLALDGAAHQDLLPIEGETKLIIIDDLPWLHEGRASILSRHIDTALYAGIEVIVTTLPSCDCLSTLQSDRVLISAESFYVSEQECAPRQNVALDENTRAFGTKRWRDARKLLFGLAPMQVWGPENGQFECLSGLLGEKLPLSLVRAIIAMLMLGSGKIDDLTHMGIDIHDDDVMMLKRDYPLFEINPVSRRFSVGEFPFSDLREAIVANKLSSVVLEGKPSLSERALSVLFERDDYARGSKLLEVFCSDERCAAWLHERGWDLLDGGKTSLLHDLILRCPQEEYAQSRDIQALHCWLSGLSGDRREACHIAERLLTGRKKQDRADIADIAARIALAMFDDNAITRHFKKALSSEEGPQDALDFLAMVLDSCTNVEIARAFRREGAPWDERYEKERKEPGRKRVKKLTLAFTEHAHRFGETVPFRLALHLFAHVDAPHIKRVVQDLGCDAIVRARKEGVGRFSTAVLVRDLWRAGYFGVVGPVLDMRDTIVLDGASHMLTVLAQCCGSDDADIPWEAQSRELIEGNTRRRVNMRECESDMMYVRLFGGFEITIGDRYVPESAWRRKAAALLTMLILYQGRDVSRDEIFAQLWPSLPRVNALDNFYTVWSLCISTLGSSVFMDRNGEFCRVDSRFVQSDVSEFERLTRHLLSSSRTKNHLLDTYAKIEVLYRGPLVPVETKVPFINVQRDRYRALYLEAMLGAVDCALHIGDSRVALWFARKAMEEDHYSEDVHFALMRAQVAAGQRCPAIKTYLKCRDHLRNSLGLDPSLEMRELYNTLITTDPELLRLDTSSFKSM